MGKHTTSPATCPQVKKEFYYASVIKRSRRTKDEINNLLEWTKSILSEDEGQITIRHLFYRLVGHSIIPKTEAAYAMLAKHLALWRRTGEISWASFADSTRWHIKSESFNGMDDALRN